ALLGLLEWLSQPLGYGFEQEISEFKDLRVTLRVLNSYLHVRREPFTPTDEREGEPALKVSVSSTRFGTLPDKWLSTRGRYRIQTLGGGLMEMLGHCDTSMLEEFLHPPLPEKLGKKGILVLGLGGKKITLPVDENLGRDARPIENTGWKARVTQYLPNLDDDSPDSTPSFPVVGFELISPAGSTYRYKAVARFTGSVMPEKDQPERSPDLAAWYHPPDHRYGQSQETRALLSFVVGRDGQLYYRTFSSGARDGFFGLESSGRAPVGPEAPSQPIWKAMKAMNFEFKVADFLPSALQKTRYVPEDHRPGLMREDLTPAIRGELIVQRGQG